MKRYFVYILASQRNGTIYVGSTSDLIQRIWQHKNNIVSGITAKYSVHELVQYEEHQNIIEMARREKRLKNWCREWKLNLIEGFNPSWRDLYEDISAQLDPADKPRDDGREAIHATMPPRNDGAVVNDSSAARAKEMRRFLVAKSQSVC